MSLLLTKLGFEKRLDQVPGDGWSHSPAAHTKNIHVIVLHPLTGGFDGVRAIAETYDDIWCSVGIHPHEAASEPETDAARLVDAITRLIALAKSR